MVENLNCKFRFYSSVLLRWIQNLEIWEMKKLISNGDVNGSEKNGDSEKSKILWFQ